MAALAACQFDNSIMGMHTTTRTHTHPHYLSKQIADKTEKWQNVTYQSKVPRQWTTNQNEIIRYESMTESSSADKSEERKKPSKWISSCIIYFSKTRKKRHEHEIEIEIESVLKCDDYCNV